MGWRRTTGFVLFALLLAIAAVGPLLSPYGIDERSPMRNEIGPEGDPVPLLPPFPPDSMHVLGTDQVGYDLLTRLLYGSRFTMGFVIGGAAIRVVLATVIASVGYLIGGYKKTYHVQEKKRTRIGTAVPEFVVVYVVFRGIIFNPTMSTLAMAAFQAVVIALVGLPNLTPLLRSRIDSLHRQPFVEAQMSVGAGPYHIFRTTIYPGVIRDIAMLIAHEALIVALIVGELAVFNIFIGGTVRTNDPVEYYSRSHEWAGMIGENRLEIFSDRLWLILIPLSAYLLLILSLSLVGAAVKNGTAD